jgi:hypothetical protein
LRGGDNLAGVRHQQPQRFQFPGRQVNLSLASPERSIDLQPKPAEGTGHILAIPATRSRMLAIVYAHEGT